MATGVRPRPSPGYTRGTDRDIPGPREGERGVGEPHAESLKDRALLGFNKFNNDWTMNLVAMVSYNVLTSFFPLLLALLTILSQLPVISDNKHAIARQINQILPSNMRSSINVESLLNSVHNAGGILTLVSIATLLWGGSNLFGSIENAFAVIFRVKTRDFMAQKLMALVMIALFAVLLPLSFASSIVLTLTNTTLSHVVPSVLNGPVGQVVGYATSLASLFVLFAAIYIVVPNVPVSWRDAWAGALIGAVGMFIVNTLFPFYTAHFVGTQQYGTALAVGAVVTITWFWFFSLILLLGAQINSVRMGLGPWPYDITRMLMDYKMPAKEGSASAIETQRGRKERDALPFSGIARDSQNVHDTPTSRPGPLVDKDGHTQQAGAVRGSSQQSGRAQVSTSADRRNDTHSTPAARSAATSAPDRPRPLDGRKDRVGGDALRSAFVEAEADGEMVATGVASGGVKMETPRAVFGSDRGPRTGVIAAGALVGLVSGIAGVLRKPRREA